MENPSFVDAIRDGEVVKVPERTAIEEGLIILKRPTLQTTYVPPSRSPLKSAEARGNTRHTLRDYHPNYVREDLVDHFHWEIARVRRLKNLTRHQLANLLNVSEEQIIFIERGELPKDDFVLVNKLEHYLGIKLRKHAVPSPAPKDPMGVPPEAPRPPLPRFDSQKSYPKEITLADLQKRKELGRKLPSQSPKQVFDESITLIE